VTAEPGRQPPGIGGRAAVGYAVFAKAPLDLVGRREVEERRAFEEQSPEVGVPGWVGACLLLVDVL
jgi:hypothetical protein